MAYTLYIAPEDVQQCFYFDLPKKKKNKKTSMSMDVVSSSVFNKILDGFQEYFQSKMHHHIRFQTNLKKKKKKQVVSETD